LTNYSAEIGKIKNTIIQDDLRRFMEARQSIERTRDLVYYVEVDRIAYFNMEGFPQ